MNTLGPQVCVLMLLLVGAMLRRQGNTGPAPKKEHQNEHAGALSVRFDAPSGGEEARGSTLKKNNRKEPGGKQTDRCNSEPSGVDAVRLNLFRSIEEGHYGSPRISKETREVSPPRPWARNSETPKRRGVGSGRAVLGILYPKTHPPKKRVTRQRVLG